MTQIGDVIILDGVKYRVTAYVRVTESPGKSTEYIDVERVEAIETPELESEE
jgi:hypothetical protein